MGLPGRFQGQGRGESSHAAIFVHGGASVAGPSCLNFAGAAAAITVHVVSVITIRDEFLSISAGLVAEGVACLSEESEAAGRAGVAVNAGCASGFAGKASQLLLIPVGSLGTGDDRSVGVGVGIGVRVGLGDALGSIPDLSSLAGDASISIKVGGGRAGFNAFSFMVNGVSDALSALSASEHELPPAEVVEFRGSVGDGALVVHGDGESEGGSVVADDEAADSAEHEVHGVRGLGDVLVFLGSNVLVVDDTVVFEILDARVEGDVGDEEEVDLGGRGG